MKVQQELMSHASNLDDHEHRRIGYVVIEAGSEWEDRGDGAQADKSERLLHLEYWEPIRIVDRL